MRKSDNVQKSEASELGREARARTQDEAASSLLRRSAQIRASEQSRAFDRQREEIHPVEVLERLTSLSPKEPAGLKLPPAVPDKDDDLPVRALSIRTLRDEPLP